MTKRKHRVKVESQTWANTGGFLATTLYRAVCTCGELQPWCYYRVNADAWRCPYAA